MSNSVRGKKKTGGKKMKFKDIIAKNLTRTEETHTFPKGKYTPSTKQSKQK